MSLALFLIGILALAFSEAQDDYEQIKGGDEINHGKQWVGRAGLVFSFAWVIVRFSYLSWWHMIPMLVGAAALFASVHRLLLNKWRGMRWYYISPSSWYDWQFLRIPMHPIDRTELVEAWHVYMAAAGAAKAGRLAYFCEALVYVGCLIYLLL